MVFGRRKRDRQSEPSVEAAGADAGEETPAAEPVPAAPTTSGPWDVADLPDDGLPRLDLGGLRVFVPDGVEMRVEVAEAGNVVAAIAAHRGSQLQLHAFAAPRLEGIWDEVRLEIAQSLKGQGGTAEETDGPFGRELRARIPGPQPHLYAPARFLGVDGPRWFLRGLLTGPAATDPAQAGVLDEVFRGTVVVRGKEAMAPRDPIPLQLPPEAQEAAAQAQASAERQQGNGRFESGDFDPFDRGPEITETR